MSRQSEPSETEHSDERSTLPPPELNPLLNPVLAQNMGRWAEVYFTNPPEKRDQAVLDLVRQLKAQNSAREEPAVTAPTSLPERSSESEEMVLPAPRVSELQPTPLECGSCGRKNPSTQKFCGMCGTRLGEAEAAAERQREDFHISDLHVEDQQAEEHPVEDSDMEASRAENPPWEEPALQEKKREAQNQELQFFRPQHDAYEPRLNTNELSLFQQGRNDSRDHYGVEDREAPRSSGSYRIYVGIAVTLILGALLYMAWRRGQATSQSSQVETPAAPPVTKEPATPAASAPSALPSASKSDQPAAASEGTPSPNNPTREAPGPVRDESAPRAVPRRAAESAALTPRVDRKAPTEAAVGTGAEELAMAQRYLNRSNGQGRNSAEAAKWLWKAMAKHNGEATLLLSDLYLRGDGVSKNCDQARILLDAAALKGLKDAGERLRHLQAFGCQ